MFAYDPEGLGRHYTQCIQQIPLTFETLHTPLWPWPTVRLSAEVAILPACATFVWDAAVPGIGGTFAGPDLVPCEDGTYCLRLLV